MKKSNIRVYHLAFRPNEPGSPVEAGFAEPLQYASRHFSVLEGDSLQKSIDDLLKILPKGVLVKDGPDALTCMKPFGYTSRLWMKRLKILFSHVNSGNVSRSWGPVEQLRRCLDNPLETEYMFCIDQFEDCWTPYPSSALMTLLGCMQAGDKVYVRAVVEG